MNSNNPREAWARLQNVLRAQSARGGSFPRGGRPPKGALGGFGGLLLLGGLYFTLNKALFNGMDFCLQLIKFRWATSGASGENN